MKKLKLNKETIAMINVSDQVQIIGGGSANLSICNICPPPPATSDTGCSPNCTFTFLKGCWE